MISGEESHDERPAALFRQPSTSQAAARGAAASRLIALPRDRARPCPVSANAHSLAPTAPPRRARMKDRPCA
jgi:hypothetical protein